MLGDPIAGPMEGLRFRSSRFDRHGNALDMCERICTRVACPQCHIEMPRALLEARTCFVSVVGAPGSGKSCLLGAASWSLRKCASQYGLSWIDVEPRLNVLLHDYETGLFLGTNGTSRKPLKTDLHGAVWYNQIRVGSRVEITPKPMFFEVTRDAVGEATEAETNEEGNLVRSTGASNRATPSILVLYDNAGEHFQPVAENAEPPYTRHLGRAQALLFVFDPTQTHSTEQSHRQDLILIEAMARVRRYRGLGSDSSIGVPLIVALTKADLWAKRIGLELSSKPIRPGNDVRLDRALIEQVSSHAGAFMAELFPELVQALGAFVEKVHWIPCSAFKTDVVDGPGKETIRPESEWAEVPLLMALSEATESQDQESTWPTKL